MFSDFSVSFVCVMGLLGRRRDECMCKEGSSVPRKVQPVEQREEHKEEKRTATHRSAHAHRRQEDSRHVFYYRKRGSATYIVREVRLVRERYIQRERERECVRRKWPHLSSAETGDEFCTFPCQNVHLSIGEKLCTFPYQKFAPLSRTPLLNGAEFTLPLHVNTLHSSKRFAFFVASVKWRDRGSKHRNKRSNFRLHRPSFHRKHESNLYQKLLEIEKEIVREVALGG